MSERKSPNLDRDALRAKLFRNKKFKTKTLDLFGVIVELRQPSVGQIANLSDSADGKTALVNTLVQYAYVPGSDEKMFDEADKNDILSWPVGPWMKDMNDAILELTSFDMAASEKN